MSSTALALLGYVVWMLVLTLAIAGLRSALILSGQRAANSFDPSGDDVSPFSARLCRTHANGYEHFPIIGGLLLFALATGQTPVTDPLALTLLAARVAQGAVHLVSTSVIAVYARFGFFVVQMMIAIYWIWSFLARASG